VNPKQERKVEYRMQMECKEMLKVAKSKAAKVTLNPELLTLNPKPSTLKPQPYTQVPLHGANLVTLNPQP